MHASSLLITQRVSVLVTVLLLLASPPSAARAERLPLKAYNTADGLARNEINKIVRDSRGFLWFCTAEGLSRFDGYTFTNYGTDQGLPNRAVNDFLETRSGEIWVGTNGGLVRFDPKGAPTDRVVYANEAQSSAPPMFTVIVPEDEDRLARAVSVVLEGRDGTLWCGTLKGLNRLDRAGGRLALRPVELGMPSEPADRRFVNDLIEDRHGSLWVAALGGLYRRWSDGSTKKYTNREGLPDENIHDLLNRVCDRRTCSRLFSEGSATDGSLATPVSFTRLNLSTRL